MNLYNTGVHLSYGKYGPPLKAFRGDVKREREKRGDVKEKTRKRKDKGKLICS
jgi:hypothetical protein